MAVIQHRRGLASVWASRNPVLRPGEIGVETNTNTFKVGDGSTAWNQLPYFVSGGGGGGGGAVAWSTIVEKPTTFPPATHNHDTRYIRTVNGTGPDAAGNVAVSGGGALPTGSMVAVQRGTSSWPTRPTGGTAIRVHWIGGSPTDPPPGIADHDLWSVPADI